MENRDERMLKIWDVGCWKKAEQHFATFYREELWNEQLYERHTANLWPIPLFWFRTRKRREWRVFLRQGKKVSLLDLRLASLLGLCVLIIKWQIHSCLSQFLASFTFPFSRPGFFSRRTWYGGIQKKNLRLLTTLWHSTYTKFMSILRPKKFFFQKLDKEKLWQLWLNVSLRQREECSYSRMEHPLVLVHVNAFHLQY